MSFTVTTRLGLVKPTPGSGELVNVATQLNSSWDKIDAAIGATICTSATRPGTPWDGQIIRETDTRRMYIWNATQAVWDPIMAGTNALFPAGGATPGMTMKLASGTASGNRAIAFRGSADTQDHYWIDYDGTNQWSSGTAAADVNLYRGAADELKTDDTFNCASLRIGSNPNTNGGLWVAHAGAAITGSTTNPTLGTGGGITSRYMQVGKTVFLECMVSFGSSGAAAGSGTYSVNLPVNASATGNMRRIGSAYFRDASATSAGHFPGIVVIDPSLDVTKVFFFNVTQQVGATFPFTWTNSDHLSFSLVYEAA